MPELTEKKAIRECKKLWREIEKSGLSKYGFLSSPDGEKWKAKNYHNSCPLCDYAGFSCRTCPLRTQYDKYCTDLGFVEFGRVPSTPEWFKAVRGLKASEV